jgi:hypothetical protein
VQGGINPGDTSFEIVIPTAGTAQHPFTGPFILRGDGIHYDNGIGALVVDLTIKNTSPNSYPLPIKLEFITLLPPNVRILNPSNGIHGPGAMIQFEFADRDLAWTPGETSLPRRVQFGINPGVSIGFAVRLHVGPAPDRGTISGVVWHDANENGVRDVDEPGLEGRGVLLAHADSLLDCVPPTDCPVIQHATTGPDGRYAFDGLDGGFYLLMLVRDRCSNPTTPPEIQALRRLRGQAAAHLLWIRQRRLLRRRKFLGERERGSRPGLAAGGDRRRRRTRARAAPRLACGEQLLPLPHAAVWIVRDPRPRTPLGLEA